MRILLCKPFNCFVEPCCAQFVDFGNNKRYHIFSNDIYSSYIYLKKCLPEFEVEIKELMPEDCRDDEFFSGYSHIILFSALGESLGELEGVNNIASKAKKCGARVVIVINGRGYLKEIINKYPYYDVGITAMDTLAALEILIKKKYFNNENCSIMEKEVLSKTNVKPWKIYQENYSFLQAEYELKKYSYNSFPEIRKQRCISAGSGCPQQCSYCQISNSPWRSKLPDQLADEIAFWTGGIELFHSNLFQNCEWLEDVLTKIIDRRPRVNIRSLGRIDDIYENLQLLPLCRRAGITRIDIGFESANKRVLASMNKKENDLKKLDTIYSKARECNIEPQLNILIGTPEENNESLAETFNALEKYAATSNCSLLRPEPETLIYETVLENELASEEDLSLENYLYRIEHLDEHEAHVRTKYLTKEEVGIWHKRFTNQILNNKLSRIDKFKRLIKKIPFYKNVLYSFTTS